MKRRFALTVGINDYPGTGADLYGCVNDAQDWGFKLNERGYEVTTLFNAAATKAAILGNLRTILSKARPGDHVVFTFSGHGTWVPDRSGDESDGRDEALVCYDYRTGGLLIDDELEAVFKSRKMMVRITIISDSCHSGSVQRFAALDNLAGDDKIARFLPPQMFFTDLTDDEVEKLEARAMSSSRPGTILLSGCADHEYSYDAWFGGRPNGALTRAALDTLDGARSVSGWYADIRDRLPNVRFPQTPQLQASRWQSRQPPLKKRF